MKTGYAGAGMPSTARPGKGMDKEYKGGGKLAGILSGGADCAVTFSGWQQLGKAWLFFCPRFVAQIDQAGGHRLRDANKPDSRK
jgi:hypothetical protein